MEASAIVRLESGIQPQAGVENLGELLKLPISCHANYYVFTVLSPIDAVWGYVGMAVSHPLVLR